MRSFEQDNNRSRAPTNPTLLPLTPRRSMEQVWMNITMSGNLNHETPIPPPLFLHRPHPATTTAASPTNLRGVVLQDFLAGAEPHRRRPATSLSLNTTPQHHSDSSPDTSHHAPCNSPPLFPAPFKRRALDEMSGAAADAAADAGGGGGGTDNDRQKRMIKNRESAARSRARKQAYINELELEVDFLMKENAKLKKQYGELRAAMDAQQLTKRTLQRTSTALF